MVTGGSRGIGAAVARMAAAQGYQVVINYVSDAASADTLKHDIEEQGGKVTTVQGDVSAAEDVERIFAAVDDCDGYLAGLVNNAGIVGQVSEFTEYTTERLRRTFEVNILGAFLCARAALQRMVAHGKGASIVNMSSAAARIGSPHEFVDYAASKGALDTMTLGLAKEFGPQAIRVNAVRPGIIRTEIHAAAGDPERVERFAAQVPLRRAGDADEVADTVMWLLSDASSYVTGALIDVTGGR